MAESGLPWLDDTKIQPPSPDDYSTRTRPIILGLMPISAQCANVGYLTPANFGDADILPVGVFG